MSAEGRYSPVPDPDGPLGGGELINTRFFILGASKAGSTALYDALRTHPQIVLSHQKETRFFELRYRGAVEEYEAQEFPAAGPDQVVGEASPMYLFLPYLPGRIHGHYSDARLIALLRHPLRRAHSNWWMHFTAKREDADFETALWDNLARIESGTDFRGTAGEDAWRRNVDAIERRGFMLYRTYVDEAFYGSRLKAWLEHFPREQLLVLDFDSLGGGGEAALEQVFDFLGVERLAGSSVPHANSAMRAALAPLVRLVAPLARQELLPRAVVDLGKRVAAGRKPPVPPLSEALRSALADHYRREYDLLGRVAPDFVIPDDWYDFFPGGER